MRRIFLLLAAGLASTSALAQPAPQHNSCFFVNQFDSWRSPDPNTIYLRTTSNRYYRLDMAGACYRLNAPDTHLVMNVHGPDTICSAVDWDLKVGDNGPGNISTPCIVKTMTELSPAEVAAIPKKFKP